MIVIVRNVVRHFIRKTDILQEEGNSVNNYAAIGYALLAADEIGLTKAQKERLWQLMLAIMDETGEARAEKRCREG